MKIMNMQFTRNGKEAKRNIPNGIWRTLLLSIVFLGAMVAKAQVTPVGAEFSGQWVFDHAEAQERPMNSKQSYTKRSVAESEFNEKTYLLQMPTKIAFMDFMAHISSPSWAKMVVAGINAGNGNVLEFRDVPVGEMPEMSAIESYPTMMPFYSNLKLNGNNMSMQCNYFYSDAQGKYTEGILTIYYKR